MNYRSIIDCFSCVEGIRLTTVVLGALTHRAIHTNYPCLGVESKLNIQFTKFNLSSEHPSEKVPARGEKKGATVDKKPCGRSPRSSTVSKVKKEAG